MLHPFAAEGRRLQHGARSTPAATDRYLLPAGRLSANPPAAPSLLSIDGTDRQTDKRTLDRYIDLAPHNMRAA